MDFTRESEIITSNLREVRDKLVHRHSTLDSLLRDDGSPVKNVTYYIQVESRPVKKDRHAYMATLEKEKLKARKRVEQRSIKCNANMITGFSGAPFDTQEERFKNRGVHPNNTDLAVRRQNPDLAPGSFNIMGENVSSRADVHQNDEWKLPFIHRELILNEKQRNEKLNEKQRESRRGPGTYNARFNPSHPTGKDTTFNRARRFLTDSRIDSIKRGHIHSNLLRDIITVPGPGSYGVPDRHVCDPREGIEMFRSGSGHAHQRLLTGSGLAPGIHHSTKGDIQERVKRMTGKLGPYEVFSSDRWGPITQGTSNVLRLQNLTETAKDPHLGPGTYDPKESRFGKHEDFHHNTAEQLMNRRNMTTSSSMNVATKDKKQNLGPGSYETSSFADKFAKEWRRVSQIGAGESTAFTAKRWTQAEKYKDNYGFLSTSKRNDKLAVDRWANAKDSRTGPGRYYAEKFEEKKRHQGLASGHKSVFKSKQPQFKQFKVVDPQEKIREQYKVTFQRNKERLEKLISQGSRQNSKRFRRTSYFPHKN